MSEEKKSFKTTFSMNTDKTKIEILKLMSEKGSVSSSDIRQYMLEKAIEDLKGQIRPATIYVLSRLSEDDLIDEKWKKDGNRAWKEYFIKSKGNDANLGEVKE